MHTHASAGDRESAGRVPTQISGSMHSSLKRAWRPMDGGFRHTTCTGLLPDTHLLSPLLQVHPTEAPP